MDINKINLVDDLDEEKVAEIGGKCQSDFLKDVAARNEKDERLKQAEKLAKQVIEKKTYPFDGASNVKYPLITKAVIEFNARVSPLICNNGEVVKIKTYGGEDEIVEEDGRPTIDEETGLLKTEADVKNNRAKKVRELMNWLITDKTDWEDEKDRLTLVYALSGFAATKNYFDYGDSLPKSELVLPLSLYWEEGKTFNKATRKSQIINISHNQVVENMRMGIFSKVESILEDKETENYDLVEMHTLLDLDEDGYKEPYIVVFEKDSGEVLRIVARYTENDILRNKNGEIARINPKEYFVYYEFMPCLDGSIFPLGLCDLLLFLNESINTNVNQLIDAGSLSNMQGGFISGNIRIKGGLQGFAPNEWKFVENAGLDISNNIVPLPTKEPSQTLFNLLGLLIDSGKEVGMLSDILNGDVAQELRPTSVLALIEQGLSGFKAILKRLHRSLKEELKLYYDMIRDHLGDIKGFYPDSILLRDVTEKDFMDDYAIIPVSDEYYATSIEKAKRSEFYLGLAMSGNPFVNVEEATRRAFQTLGLENYSDLLVKPQPAQPDPALQAQLQLVMEQAKRLSVQNQIDFIRLNIEKMKADSEVANKTLDTQSMTVKRDAEAVAAMANAEAKETGVQNPAYIRQAKDMATFTNNQAKEQINGYGRNNPERLGELQNNGNGGNPVPVSQQEPQSL